MKRFLQTISEKYLSHELDFRVRLFFVLAIAGFIINAVTAVSALLIGSGLWLAIVNAITAISCAALWMYAKRTGRYNACYKITIIVIFFISFTFMFFTGGGYRSAMPSFFISAVVFTAFMIKGRAVIILSVAELLYYAGLCVLDYQYPELIPPLSSQATMLVDVMIGFVSVAIMLSVTVFIHFRMYDKQQELLAERNAELDRINRSKTEFFASVSHEMKTPLTVVSVHIQRAEALLALNRAGDAEKIQESFALARDEIMRMSRLVDSALRLSSIQELGGQHTVLNISELLHTTADAYRALLEKQGNTLTLDLPESLPPVQGSADNLVHLLSNLLSNAGAYTRNGEVRMSAAINGKTVTLSIVDNGGGIPPQLLSRVFERGVSGNGGSGLGLPIAKEIAEAHGGSITVASERGMGTTVTVTLPAYKEEVIHA